MILEACLGSTSHSKASMSVFRNYEVFEKGFTNIRPQMPQPVKENVDSLLHGVFDASVFLKQ